MIGADGLHSLVAREVAGADLQRAPRADLGLLQLLERRADCTASSFYRHGRRGHAGLPDQRRADLRGDAGAAGDVPGVPRRHRGATSRATLGPRSRRCRARARRPARRALPGTADLPNFFRKPLRPRLGAGGRRGLPQGPGHRPRASATPSATRTCWPRRSTPVYRGKAAAPMRSADYEARRNAAAFPSYEANNAGDHVRPATGRATRATRRFAREPGGHRPISAWSWAPSRRWSSSRRRTWPASWAPPRSRQPPRGPLRPAALDIARRV